MPRPKQDPEQAFIQETSIWQAAMGTKGGFFRAESPKRAIHIMHRLNMARAAIRAKYPGRLLAWDNFVVRPRPDGVSIEPKRALVDLFSMTDLAGNTIDPADINEAAMQPILPAPDNEILTPYGTLKLGQSLGPTGPDPDKVLGDLETE